MRIALLVLVAALAIPFVPSVAWGGYPLPNGVTIYGCEFTYVKHTTYKTLTDHVWFDIEVTVQNNTGRTVDLGPFEIAIQWGGQDVYRSVRKVPMDKVDPGRRVLKGEAILFDGDISTTGSHQDVTKRNGFSCVLR